MLDTLAQFRGDVRVESIKSQCNSITECCDKLRDSIADLGVRIVDSGSESKWSFEDKETLREEKQERLKSIQLKEDKKKKENDSKEQREREKLEKSKISHLEMFKTSE